MNAGFLSFFIGRQLETTGKGCQAYTTEMQVNSEPANDACNFREDNFSDSRCISDWMDGNKSSPLLERSRVRLFASLRSGALSERAVLPLAPHCEQVESSLAAPLEVLVTPGVYIPAGSSYNLHYEGKNLVLQISELQRIFRVQVRKRRLSPSLLAHVLMRTCYPSKAKPCLSSPRSVANLSKISLGCGTPRSYGQFGIHTRVPFVAKSFSVWLTCKVRRSTGQIPATW